jgi:hypothetical protein
MAFRAIIQSLAAAATVVPSIVAMADQSDEPIGTHEIPPFVLERVELTAGLAAPAVSHPPHMAGRAEEQDRCVWVQPQGT